MSMTEHETSFTADGTSVEDLEATGNAEAHQRFGDRVASVSVCSQLVQTMLNGFTGTVSVTLKPQAGVV